MGLTKCKRCDAEGMFWAQSSATGKWELYENHTSKKHFCEDGKLKIVKCKYCSADDLHWAEEVNPVTQQKKAVLTESYGLPHACDERIAFLAKEKQDKKDKYEVEKKRINTHPDGPCLECNHGYRAHNSNLTPVGICPNCHGQASFTARTRKSMLASVRQHIWPGMKDNSWSQHRRRWW